MKENINPEEFIQKWNKAQKEKELLNSGYPIRDYLKKYINSDFLVPEDYEFINTIEKELSKPVSFYEAFSKTLWGHSKPSDGIPPFTTTSGSDKWQNQKITLEEMQKTMEDLKKKRDESVAFVVIYKQHAYAVKHRAVNSSNDVYVNGLYVICEQEKEVYWKTNLRQYVTFESEMPELTKMKLFINKPICKAALLQVVKLSNNSSLWELWVEGLRNKKGKVDE